VKISDLLFVRLYLGTGGGKFVPKTGTALDLEVLSRAHGPAVELPADCLPSEKSLDRHYEAITINHSKYMKLFNAPATWKFVWLTVLFTT
jgi:hypothetical protein